MNFQQDHDNENRLCACRNAFLHQIRIETIIDILHDDIKQYSKERLSKIVKE